MRQHDAPLAVPPTLTDARSTGRVGMHLCFVKKFIWWSVLQRCATMNAHGAESFAAVSSRGNEYLAGKERVFSQMLDRYKQLHDAAMSGSAQVCQLALRGQATAFHPY